MNVSAELFQTIRLDFERLVLPLADCGVHLAAGLGKGVPVITNDNICFNGVRSCGHPKNDEICYSLSQSRRLCVGRSASAVYDSSEPLITRIKYRCCDGRRSYETFNFPRSLEFDAMQQPEANGLYFEFTKTAFRPYDIAVTARLLIAKRRLKDQLMVHSDGLDRQWSDAKRICQEVLGYGDWFGIVEEEIEERSQEERVARNASLRTLIEIYPPM